jgi:hypothetical protein
LELFDDVDEKEEVEDLLKWWNRLANRNLTGMTVLNPDNQTNLSRLLICATFCDHKQCACKD